MMREREREERERERDLFCTFGDGFIHIRQSFSAIELPKGHKISLCSNREIANSSALALPNIISIPWESSPLHRSAP